MISHGRPPADQVFCPECPLPRRAPDVDAAGIQYKDVAVGPVEGRPQGVEAQRIVKTGDLDPSSLESTCRHASLA